MSFSAGFQEENRIVAVDLVNDIFSDSIDMFF